MDRMAKARSKMLLRHPFFATLMMSTPNVETRDVPTAATDMKTLFYNPDFIASLPNDDHVMFVLAHEVMHIALEHGLRLRARNHRLFNIACDYAINLILKDSGFDVLEGCLIDEKYRDMSADHIYDLLRKEAEKRPQSGQGEGPPQDGFGDSPGVLGQDIREPEGGGSAEEAAKTQRSIQQRVAQAASIARMAGKLSGSLERLVDEILNPSVPWQDLLRDYMTRTSKDDETWARRNRRFSQVYLPSHHSERMGELILIGDTSGSISAEDLNKVAAEVNAIAESVQPECIRVLWADTKVQKEEVFEVGDEIKLHPTGGGGTDMRVPISYAETLDAQVIVLVTDGYTPWPQIEPSIPLIVVCTTDVAVPVGLVVRV